MLCATAQKRCASLAARPCDGSFFGIGNNRAPGVVGVAGVLVTIVPVSLMRRCRCLYHLGKDTLLYTAISIYTHVPRHVDIAGGEACHLILHCTLSQRLAV